MTPEGCTLAALLDWVWLKLVQLKQEKDQLCKLQIPVVVIIVCMRACVCVCACVLVYVLLTLPLIDQSLFDGIRIGDCLMQQLLRTHRSLTHLTHLFHVLLEITSTEQGC